MNAPSERSQWEITRRLFDLAWPIIGLNILTVLALAVDTAMVGRVPDAEAALTGMGYASQVVFLLMVAMIGLTVGTVAFVARAHGAGHDDVVMHQLQQSTQLTVGLGLAVAVVGNVFAVPLLWLLGAEGAAMDAGLDYLRPLLAGAAFYYLNILYAAVLRGVGNTRVAFGVSLVSNGLNVLFNYGLILGNFGLPALGILGAALGTVASQACGAALMVYLLSKGVVRGVTPVFGIAPLDRDLARDLARVGWPAAVDLVVLNAGFLSIIGMLARIDQVAVAAHGIGLRIQALAFVPGMSISQATGAMVGNALGAGSVREARRVTLSGLVLCVSVMSVLAVVLVGFDDQIVELFDVERGTDLHTYSVQWMRLLGYGMPVVGLYIAFVGMLQGSGATRLSLRINAVVTLLLQIPLSYLLGFPLGLGAWGVWAAFPLSFVAKFAWGWREYLKGDWAKVGARA